MQLFTSELREISQSWWKVFVYPGGRFGLTSLFVISFRKHYISWICRIFRSLKIFFSLHIFGIEENVYRNVYVNVIWCLHKLFMSRNVYQGSFSWLSGRKEETYFPSLGEQALNDTWKRDRMQRLIINVDEDCARYEGAKSDFGSGSNVGLRDFSLEDSGFWFVIWRISLIKTWLFCLFSWNDKNFWSWVCMNFKWSLFWTDFIFFEVVLSFGNFKHVWIH